MQPLTQEQRDLISQNYMFVRNCIKKRIKKLSRARFGSIRNDTDTAMSFMVEAAIEYRKEKTDKPFSSWAIEICLRRLLSYRRETDFGGNKLAVQIFKGYLSHESVDDICIATNKSRKKVENAVNILRIRGKRGRQETISGVEDKRAEGRYAAIDGLVFEANKKLPLLEKDIFVDYFVAKALDQPVVPLIDIAKKHNICVDTVYRRIKANVIQEFVKQELDLKDDYND